MEIKYKLIKTKDELLKYKDKIAILFNKCFNKEMNSDMWNWMYILNPIGDPIVSLCFNDSDELIGHYASIPLPIIINGKAEISIISIGSMVDKTYRKYGLFVKQGEEVYSYAKNKYNLVFGFPNKMAVPARKKRLSWKIDENDYVALVTKEELIKNLEFNNFLKLRKNIEIDLNKKGFQEWRLSKPGTKYIVKDSLILKEFDGSFDIVYINVGYENSLENNVKYNILCDSSIQTMKKNKVFDYPFGYKVFDTFIEGVKFKKDLIMSDVF